MQKFGETIKILWCVIQCFEAVYGLSVNLANSYVFCLIQVDDLWHFVDALGCQKGTLPSLYLGLPLGAPFNNKESWNPVLEIIHRRLVG